MTLSHTSGADRPALLERTIGDDLDATAARFPDHDALVDVAGGARWTYRRVGRSAPRDQGRRSHVRPHPLPRGEAGELCTNGYSVRKVEMREGSLAPLGLDH